MKSKPTIINFKLLLQKLTHSCTPTTTPSQVARDSTKNTPTLTKTNNATTLASSLPTVTNPNTTSSLHMVSNLAIRTTATATTKSSPTKNNQEKVEDPMAKDPTTKGHLTKTITAAAEAVNTTWTHALVIKSRMATKSSNTREKKILATMEISRQEVPLKWMISKDMVVKNKAKTTTVVKELVKTTTKVLVKTTIKVQDLNKLTQKATILRKKLPCKIQKTKLSRTLLKKRLKFRLLKKVSNRHRLLLKFKKHKSKLLYHSLKVSVTNLWLQKVSRGNNFQ